MKHRINTQNTVRRELTKSSRRKTNRALEKWEDKLYERYYAEGTLTNYVGSIKMFIRYCKKYELDWSAPFNPRNVAEYFMYHVKITSIHALSADLSAFTWFHRELELDLKWLNASCIERTRKLLGKNFVKEKNTRVAILIKHLVKWLTEIAEAFFGQKRWHNNMAYKLPRRILFPLMVAICHFMTGCRQEEVICTPSDRRKGLKYRQCHWRPQINGHKSFQHWHFLLKYYKNKKTRAQRQERYVGRTFDPTHEFDPCSLFTIFMLRQCVWHGLKPKTSNFMNLPKNENVFTYPDGSQFKIAQYNALILPPLHRAYGFLKRGFTITSHSLRIGTATEMICRGFQDSMCYAYIGWKPPKKSMTLIYVRPDAEQLVEVMRKMFNKTNNMTGVHLNEEGWRH
jgi:hypothetical protein